MLHQSDIRLYLLLKLIWSRPFSWVYCLGPFIFIFPFYFGSLNDFLFFAILLYSNTFPVVFRSAFGRHFLPTNLIITKLLPNFFKFYFLLFIDLFIFVGKRA